MNKTAAQTGEFLDTFLPRVGDLTPDVEIVIAPPFTSLSLASQRLTGTRVLLGAQNMHWELHGPFTGEVSVLMLREFGVSHVIVGHSERRAYFNETDLTVNLKVHTALAHGLVPIVAVGETLDEHAADRTDERVLEQTRAAFAGVAPEDLRRCVIAYEPIWAIGTGQNCDVDDAEKVMGLIRAAIDGLGGTPILYGGSMNAQNAAAYTAQPNIDGGLVGGASLDPDGFAALISNACAAS